MAMAESSDLSWHFLALAGRYTGVAFTFGVSEYFDGIRAWDNVPGQFGSIVVRELIAMFELYQQFSKYIMEVPSLTLRQQDEELTAADARFLNILSYR